jgi:predicted RND superfamily exporter protein
MNISSRERIAQTLRAQEQQLLRLFAYLTTTYTKSVLGVCFAFSVLATFYTVSHLEFVTGRNDLIASDKRYVQLDEEYSKEFMGIDQVVVVVEPRDVQQGKEFVTRLGELLAYDTLHVQDVFYHIDTTSLEGKKLLYLSSDDLRSLHDNLEEYQDLIHDLTTQPGINTLFRSINQQVSSGLVSHMVSGFLGLDSSETSATTANEKKPLKITFLLSLLQEMERALHNSTYSYHSPWAQFFGGTEELSDNGYLVSENRRFVFLMVEPKETEGAGFSEDQASIAAIRQAVTSLIPKFPGLAAGVTGTKAIDNDQAVSTQADAATATVVSFVGVALLYLVFFKRIRHPLLIVINLTVGLIWTMGFVTLTVGHLTIITVFVAPLLLGLADDFSVHFIARYEEECSQGNTVVSALYTVFGHTVPGIAAGAFTTALAFSALMLTDFQGVQELGLITGGGMLLCLVATLTFLPALLMAGEIYRPWMVRPGERTLLSGSFTLL